MILRPGTHRYDRRLYPKSRLPGIAVCLFESEIAGDATVRASYDGIAPHDATTRRGTDDRKPRPFSRLETDAEFGSRLQGEGVLPAPYETLDNAGDRTKHQRRIVWVEPAGSGEVRR